MASVLDQAQNFSGGPVAAARKRESWLRKAANTSDEETAAQYREAAADLAARYPDIAELEPGQAEAFARDRGHGSGSRSPVHEGRRRARTPASTKTTRKEERQGRAPGQKPVPGLDPTARRRASAARRSSARPTPRIDRAIRQTGIPAASSSAGSMILSLLGATVGMGLLFLILNTAEKGGTGTSRLLRLVEHDVPGAVGRFLDPSKDIFPAAGGQSQKFEGQRFASPSELDRVESGSHGIPGEIGTAGIATGDLSNPRPELQPRRHRPRGHHR